MSKNIANDLFVSMQDDNPAPLLSIPVAIADHLNEVGDTMPVKGRVDREGYELGDHEFGLPSGISYDFLLTNTGDGILASGTVGADVVGECDRCLEEADFTIDVPVTEYYLYRPPSESELENDDFDYTLIDANGIIDLGGPVMGAVIMETPFVVLCKDDCKGLCPTCGANLNEGPCGCHAEVDAEAPSSNPFAVLKDLNLSDDDHANSPEAGK